MYEYTAYCIRVIDGDTYEMDIDLGFGLHLRGDESPSATIRLKDIDTPETHRVSRDSPEWKHGLAAKQRVEDLLIDQDVIVRTVKNKDYFGKYGRFLASIELPDGRDLASVLREEGFVKKAEY